MAVWGVGANWDGKDVSKEFVGYGTAAIGYNEADKNTYHKLIRSSVNLGDLIFIKAKFTNNGKMHIKAIGIIIDANLCKENGYSGQDGIRVHWVKDTTNNPVEIASPHGHGSTLTFYEEKNTDVIRTILNLL